MKDSSRDAISRPDSIARRQSSNTVKKNAGSPLVASPAGGILENYAKRRKNPMTISTEIPPSPSQVPLSRATSISASTICKGEDEAQMRLTKSTDWNSNRRIQSKTTDLRTSPSRHKRNSGAVETNKNEEATKSNILFSIFDGMSDRWKNWVIRGIFGLLMVAGFFFIIYLGPVALILLTLAIQVRCFAEVINIGYTIYKVHNLSWFRFRSLSWYFLIASNYFFYMETSLGIRIATGTGIGTGTGTGFISSANPALSSSTFKTDTKLHPDFENISLKTEDQNSSSVFQFLVVYNRFISFCLYMVGFLWFFLSLSLAKKSKKYRGIKIEMNQYNLFAFTHVCLLMVVAQSYLIIQNIFEGMIWFIVPVSMIVCNDAMAYFFGFFMGRTPLIQLSPKKTWEGYVGGGFATVIFGLFASHWLCQFPWFTCPVQYTDSVLKMMPNLNCDVSYLFQLQEYGMPRFLVELGMEPYLMTYPFVLHSLALSVFSSVIGPFGGFFASGFKRAFKIKDFAAVIPGHGGVLDRFDCQFLMATFVNVYITSFIRQPSPQRLLQQALDLKVEAQLDLLSSLGEHLKKEGLL